MRPLRRAAPDLLPRAPGSSGGPLRRTCDGLPEPVHRPAPPEQGGRVPGPPPPAARKVSTEEEIQAYTIGGAKRHDAPVTIVDYDPEWPALLERENDRTRGTRGERAGR